LEIGREDLSAVAGKLRLLRSQLALPIIIVADGDEDQFREWRFLGASECLRPPVSIIYLHTVTQQLLDLQRSSAPPARQRVEQQSSVSVGSLSFSPRTNVIEGPSGGSAQLTTSEARLLSLFAEQPQTTVTRGTIANAIYGRHRPVTDRAIDVIVNRLRKKLGDVGGRPSRSLIRTEFRRGYSFVGGSEDPQGASAGSAAAYDVASGERHQSSALRSSGAAMLPVR
jgi:DNA-binding response OmpR family regulator